MQQGTLWELDEKIDSAAHPAWGQFNPVAKAEVLEKLSALMAKAVRPHPDPQPGEKENAHE
jgi:hypothetical protein